MKRDPYKAMNCSVAAALSIIGDPWTLLIVRDAFFQVRRFEEFQANLGIARNILTARLRKLVDAGILRKVPYQERPRRFEYRLTDKGAALFPVIVSLKEWGDQWGDRAEEGPPLELQDRRSGTRIEPVLIDRRTGEKIDLSSVRAVAGPGATESVTRFLSWIAAQRMATRAGAR